MISASLLMKEGELRIEPSWRISVHRCWNSVNLLLEVILLKSILPVYSYQQALSRSLTHSPPPWLSRNNPVSLGIYSAFSHFCNNQRQRETDLSICGAQRDWPRYLSSVSNRAVSSCLTDGSETIPPGHGIQAWARLVSQSSLHLLNCHQGFSIGGWPSVVTCPLTAGLRPLESSAKLPLIDDLQI